MKSFFQKIISFIVVLVLPVIVIYLTIHFGLARNEARKVDFVGKSEHTASVDHADFEILKKEYTNPKDVTAACLSCHNKRDDELMQSSHWTWERTTEIPGRGVVNIGKKNLINNFCTGAEGNNGSCMRCHIGYGWADKSFDFTDATNIDCLVCHDKSNTYFKQKSMAGWPATPATATKEFPVPDYNLVSQSVGLPDRDNCGVCHFYGGGGNNVKHGDLEEALFHTTKDVDVHMGEDGKNMVCIDCHQTEKHNIKGKAYSVSASNSNRIGCEQCHTSAPHNDRIIDYHTTKVACQTCHIPVYAKVNATTLYWDWSPAGRKDEQGNAIKEYDADHNYSYLSIKGHFVFDNKVKPEYYWFNGTVDHFLTGDTVKEIPVQINRLFGEYNDSTAKIWPVKVHRGKQPFDPVTKQILSMKLFAYNKGEGAFWEDLDWEKSIQEGMDYNERYWSGKYEFYETEVYWPLNHMVSKKAETLSCTECHIRDNGRLASLNDFYLPGRDYNKWIDYSGMGIIVISILGVVIHSILRFFS
jgi:octaheme c-type cytochrome (tetrathionate reductase family)